VTKNERNLEKLERNLLAVLLAKFVNRYYIQAYGGSIPKGMTSGWYVDSNPEMVGFQRVISIDGGIYTFHVPDNFDLGDLPEIKPNWTGHTTDEKWATLRRVCNMREE
jgi:hypothetical protein